MHWSLVEAWKSSFDATLQHLRHIVESWTLTFTVMSEACCVLDGILGSLAS